MSEQTVLTNRQREVLHHMSHGYTEQQIGHQLGITAHTVRDHKREIYYRLGVHSVAHPGVAAVGAGFERNILL